MKKSSLSSRRRRLFVLTTLWIGLATAGAQCNPGDILVGEDADSYYCMEKAKYEGSAAQQKALTFCHAKQQVAADQAAIKTLGFATDAERFELYTGVATAQKTQFQHRILSALFDQGLNATQLAVDSASSLNPVNVNQAVETLEKNRFDYATVVSALKYLANQSGKPAKAAAYRAFTQKLKGAKEAWETQPEMSSDAKNANLRLTVGALKIMQGNPSLGLVITGFKFGENIAYLLYLTGRVDDLSTESDARLARLDELTDRLQDHVAAMTDAKTAWRQSTGYKSAAPTCAR
jgi:hypothetical protein